MCKLPPQSDEQQCHCENRQISITATGGQGGATPSSYGDGARITLSAGDQLSVNAASLLTSPLGTNGNGAQFTFSAVGALSTTGTISANSVNGNEPYYNAGFINISGQSTVSIGGTLSATGGQFGGNAGSVTVASSGSGGITFTAGGNIITDAYAGGTPGNITINTNNGALSLGGNLIQSNAFTSGTAGTISIQTGHFQLPEARACGLMPTA